MEYKSPMEDELDGGKFKYSAVKVKFRGQDLPSHFNITYKGKREPKDGQVIGHTRMGQTLYWKDKQVIARG